MKLMSFGRFRKVNRRLYQKYGQSLERQESVDDVSRSFRKSMGGKSNIRYCQSTKLLSQIKEVKSHSILSDSSGSDHSVNQDEEIYDDEEGVSQPQSATFTTSQHSFSQAAPDQNQLNEVSSHS